MTTFRIGEIKSGKTIEIFSSEDFDGGSIKHKSVVTVEVFGISCGCDENLHLTQTRCAHIEYVLKECYKIKIASPEISTASAIACSMSERSLNSFHCSTSILEE